MRIERRLSCWLVAVAILVAPVACRRADERPADGIDDTFAPVAPGTVLHFAVRLANRTVPPADYDQVFRVQVVIWGDDLVLARRTIRIEVPRGRLLPDGGPDASDADASASATDGGGDGG